MAYARFNFFSSPGTGRSPARRAGRRWLLPALAGTFLCALAVPGQAAPSTFPASCTHIGIAGDTLDADCRRDDGSLNHTSITLPGIGNVDGVLRFEGLGHASTFQNSCAHISVAGSLLAADCRSNDGHLNRTSIRIPDITSVNGVLTIASSGTGRAYGGRQAAASYRIPDGGPTYVGGYEYDGQSYGWYDEGWRGAGFYVIGFASRTGLGYGGGEGWRGWHHGGGVPAHRGRPAQLGRSPAGFRHGRPFVHQAIRFERGNRRPHVFRPVIRHRGGFHPRFTAHRGGGFRPHFRFRRSGSFHPHGVRRFTGFRRAAFVHRGGFRPVFHRGFVRPRRHR